MSNKPNKEKDIKPEFEYGINIMIEKPSFIVDKNGNGWWIDPYLKEIRKAS